MKNCLKAYIQKTKDFYNNSLKFSILIIKSLYLTFHQIYRNSNTFSIQSHNYLFHLPILSSTTKTMHPQQPINLQQSRILFEQVVVDNQPTQQQVIQRAQQLQIDDLLLARQSLTKQLQSHWRPYINRYGDVYYINLKQQRAYVDHPVDMDTKILYAKRYKTKMPKFKSYELSDVVGTIRLIEQETIKWRRGGQFSFTRQSGPSQLNIVYQQSQQSQTQRGMQSENNSYVSQPQQMEYLNYEQNQDYSQQDDDQQEYIENLQHTGRLQRQNIIMSKAIEIHQNVPKVFNKGHKRFPTIQGASSQDQQKQIQKQKEQLLQLSPQYQRLLLEYEQQLRREHTQQLKRYKKLKQQNFNKKENMLKDIIKDKQEKYKLQVIRQFEKQTEEKNIFKFQKDMFKVKSEFTQKINNFQQKLIKEQQIMQKLQTNLQQKRIFVQSLEEKLQSRLLQQKFIKTQQLNKNIYQNFYFSKIKEISEKEQQNFQKTAFKVINQKIDDKIREKGVYEPLKNEVIYPGSLSALYQSLVKKQLKSIDNLLVQNEVNRQMRKNRKSIFLSSKKQKQIKNYDSQKENDPNNFNLRQQKRSIIQQIEKDIQNYEQTKTAFRQRRNKIFEFQNSKLPIDKDFTQSIKYQCEISIQRQDKQKQSYSHEIKKQLWSKQNHLDKTNLIKPDKKSMYLRMMKRIL